MIMAVVFAAVMKIIDDLQKITGKGNTLMDPGRRKFFTNTLLRKTLDCVTETKSAFQRGMSEAEYFRTFENAYPMISECYDFLEEEAEKLGIDTRDKSKLEIAREIHMTLKEVEV